MTHIGIPEVEQGGQEKVPTFDDEVLHALRLILKELRELSQVIMMTIGDGD